MSRTLSLTSSKTAAIVASVEDVVRVVDRELDIAVAQMTGDRWRAYGQSSTSVTDLRLMARNMSLGEHKLSDWRDQDRDRGGK